jgi:D-beta-D-heptose 7-phosphate kinase/D-beta-D-heptose 1-phosphate adenosyltransferase
MDMWSTFQQCLQGRRPRVLVLGDVMCDVYVSGTVHRISPEAPVPVFQSTEQRHALGGAANVAANLHALGCDVSLVAVIGADVTGQEVRALLRQHEIADSWLVEDATRPTTTKTRLIAQQQQMLRLDHEVCLPVEPTIQTRVVDYARALLSQVDGLVCSDYAKGVCTPEVLRAIFTQARAAATPVVVDPKVADLTLYRGATVFTPNLSEVEHASGMALKSEADIERAARDLLRRSEAEAMLVTRGKDGMTLVREGHSPVHIPAQAREVFDVTGAGDTAVATFSMALLNGLALPDAAHVANTAAGMVVGKMGTAVVSLEELQAALRREVSAPRKIMGRTELARIVREHQQRGERVVFTNGCFDLLHIGHMRYLQQARTLGDRLLIALNDDASVQRLKGAQRPLIPQDERAGLLAALACVDYVTVFAEDTPLALIQQLRPDVLVKGGDYTPETVVGRAEVEVYGGTVVIVPYVDEVSTTGIIHSILKRYSSPESRE